MKKLIMILLVLAATPAIASSVFAVEKSSKKVEKSYQYIEVVRFDVEKGVQFPADFLASMNEQLIDELNKTKKFRQVFREGETLPDNSAPAIRLVGKIYEFKPGSRAKRYFISFGAGTTKVSARIKLIDSATGELLYEKDINGKVEWGLLGGDSSGAPRDLARNTAKAVKKKLF